MHRIARVFAIIGLMLVILVGCVKVDSIKEPTSFVKELSSNTVALVYKDKLGSVQVYCTGVWLDNDYIVTAHHCVQAIANRNADSDIDVDVLGTRIYFSQENEMMGMGEDPAAMHMARVVVDNGLHDVSLLKASGKGIPSHTYASLADQLPAVGERVHIVGHVKGLYWTYVHGYVTSHRGDIPLAITNGTHGPFIQMYSPVYYGNSGGGVFNSDGELVGIVSFMLGAPLTNFAIPVKYVRRMVIEVKDPGLKK
jgi:S1-C subfamily serine protease